MQDLSNFTLEELSTPKTDCLSVSFVEGGEDDPEADRRYVLHARMKKGIRASYTVHVYASLDFLQYAGRFALLSLLRKSIDEQPSGKPADRFKAGQTVYSYSRGKRYRWTIRERTQRGYVLQRPTGKPIAGEQKYSIVFLRTQDANRKLVI